MVGKPGAVSINAEHLATIVDHALSGAPEEVCGILAGRDGRVLRVLKGRNVAPNPRVRYELDPNQHFAYFEDMEKQGEEMVGIYHSHPYSPAYPSSIDLEMAYYPGSVYLIVSLLARSGPEAKAFRIVDGTVQEVELCIDE